jgi:membrane protein implicated in regulation of membrane protease activity
VGVSCIVAAAMSLFGLSLHEEVIIGLLAFAVAWVTLRPWLLRLHFRNETGLTIHSLDLIGKIGVVSQAIDPIAGSGRVVVENQDWKAVALYDGVFNCGEQVEIVSVDGAKLFVRPVSV